MRVCWWRAKSRVSASKHARAPQQRSPSIPSSHRFLSPPSVCQADSPDSSTRDPSLRQASFLAGLIPAAEMAGWMDGQAASSVGGKSDCRPQATSLLPLSTPLPLVPPLYPPVTTANVPCQWSSTCFLELRSSETFLCFWVLLPI